MWSTLFLDVPICTDSVMAAPFVHSLSKFFEQTLASVSTSEHLRAGSEPSSERSRLLCMDDHVFRSTATRPACCGSRETHSCIKQLCHRKKQICDPCHNTPVIENQAHSQQLSCYWTLKLMVMEKMGQCGAPVDWWAQLHSSPPHD